jgi:hypothetical protein
VKKGARRIVELEDRGQDFTEFLLNGNNTIVDVKPFQAWVWMGFRIMQKRIRPGMAPRLEKRGQLPVTLKYRVVSVRLAN